MSRFTDNLKADIEYGIDKLKDKIHEKPWPWIVGAFVLGIIIGASGAG